MNHRRIATFRHNLIVFALVWIASAAVPPSAHAECPSPTLFAVGRPSECRPAKLRFGRLFAAEPLPVRRAVPLSFTDPQDPANQTPPQNQPPPRQHTGLRALFRQSLKDFVSFPKRKSTYVILAVGGALAAAGHPLDDNINPGSKGVRRIFLPGRYIGYSWFQASAALGTYIVGRYVIKPPEGKTNKVSRIGFDLLRANILTQALTYGIKAAVQRDRPTGECCSFPSGHASVAFASASVLERHFGYRAAWPTFLVGAYVAASRLVDNRHFLSDVMFGSALGIAAGWTVVSQRGREEFALVPVPVRGGMAVMFTRTGS